MTSKGVSFAGPVAVLPSLLFGVLVAGGSPLTAQEGLTHERMIETLRLGVVAPAPDGERVVVQVQRWSYERRGAESELWLVDAADPEAPLTLALKGQSPRDPAWSADGARIAYVADPGDGSTQLFVHDLTDGTHFQLTRIRTGVRTPRFSPDGSHLSFLSRVYPAQGSPEASAEEMDRRAADPSSARIHSGFPYRDYGNQWFDGRVDHLHLVDARGGTPVDLLAGSALATGPGWSGVMEYDWHPDGSSAGHGGH